MHRQKDTPHQHGPTTAINVGKNERLVSMVGGSLLMMLALWRRGWTGLGIGLAAVPLWFRGISGLSLIYRALRINRALVDPQGNVSVPHQQGLRVSEAVTIYNRTPAELYQMWRNFENLPEFMENVLSVEVLSRTRSHWVVKAPLGRRVEWDAEIVNEQENEHIGWRTLHKSRVDHAGSVHFKEAPGSRGTEVHVVLEYAPPAGPLGALVANLFGSSPQQQIAHDLYRFKQLMEAGEIATVEGQPSGRQDPHAEREIPRYRKYQTQEKDVVQVASEESFPASDPPGYY